MRHPVDISLGQALRHLRLMRGLTQAQLAGAVGIRFQQVQKYESGANRISAARLWSIARALETDIGAFFAGVRRDGDPGSLDPIEEVMQRKETIDLVRAFHTMDERPRRRFLELARAMSGDDRPQERDAWDQVGEDHL